MFHAHSLLHLFSNSTHTHAYYKPKKPPLTYHYSSSVGGGVIGFLPFAPG